MHRAQALWLETACAQLGEKRRRLDRGIHETDTCSSPRQAARSIEEHAEGTAACTRTRRCRRPSATRLDVRWVAHHEIRRSRGERADIANVGAEDVDAIAPSVGARVRVSELRERGIDLDHRDAIGGAEMKQRKAHRADPCAEVEGRSGAPRSACSVEPRGERRQEHRIHVHAIATASRGLGERDLPSEEGVLRDARYFCHGRRPRKLSAVTAPGNV